LSAFADAKDDRDGRGRSFGYLGSKVAGWGGDDGHAPTHKVSHDRRKTIELALEPVVLDRHVLALGVAGFVETLAERGSKGRIGRSGIDESHDRHHRLLLCARRERPRRHPAEQRDEFASSQLIELHSVQDIGLARFSAPTRRLGTTGRDLP
jgi:hypothetical protein